MHVLITGGSGFIGSHLTERCLAEGWTVTVLDDLSTGTIENVAAVRDHPRFVFRQGSVFDQRKTQHLVDASDVVVHLAAAVGVRLIIDSPVRAIETNVYGTEVVLQASARSGKRVILASTSEVYGKNTAFPCYETGDLVLGPSTVARWSYACSKLLDEFLGIAYWREKGVPVNAVRIFNTIGPRQSGQYGMVVPTFVRQALRGEPITVYGDGLQTRCFCDVADLVEVLVRLVQRTDVAGEVINVGNDDEISIIDLARVVKEVTRSPSTISFVPYGEAYGVGFEDTARRVPALAKVEAVLGYRPRTPLRDTLAKIIAPEQVKLGARESDRVS
jgi:UDP-glucose 4-epimerase